MSPLAKPSSGRPAPAAPILGDPCTAAPPRLEAWRLGRSTSSSARSSANALMPSTSWFCSVTAAPPAGLGLSRRTSACERISCGERGSSAEEAG